MGLKGRSCEVKVGDWRLEAGNWRWGMGKSIKLKAEIYKLFALYFFRLLTSYKL
jgi:hypothetical protein